VGCLSSQSAEVGESRQCNAATLWAPGEHGAGVRTNQVRKIGKGMGAVNTGQRGLARKAWLFRQWFQGVSVVGQSRWISRGLSKRLWSKRDPMARLGAWAGQPGGLSSRVGAAGWRRAQRLQDFGVIEGSCPPGADGRLTPRPEHRRVGSGALCRRLAGPFPML